MKHLYCLLVGGGLLGGVAGQAATFKVEIRDYYFTPTNLTINVGDTVQWTNASAAMSHDSTSTNAAFVWTRDLIPGATGSIQFTNAGVFPYLCSRHVFAGMNKHLEQTGTVTVAAANLPPSVALTNPANNAKFRAPANITLQSSASDPGGSVTNVQYFAGEAFCGSSTNAPYTFVLSNVAAGNYLFSARAFDNLGAAATSPPVNLFVFTNATLTTPIRGPNGRVRFTVLGISNQTYALEFSTNLTSWSAFATNLAPANSFSVTDVLSTNILRRLYRARQDF